MLGETDGVIFLSFFMSCSGCISGCHYFGCISGCHYFKYLHGERVLGQYFTDLRTCLPRDNSIGPIRFTVIRSAKSCQYNSTVPPECHTSKSKQASVCISTVPPECHTSKSKE
jgi:hypothetical protein